MRKRKTTRTSMPWLMRDGVPVSVPRVGHINQCCYCNARHEQTYLDDPRDRSRILFSVQLIKPGRRK
jgi:hypothetical protein